jgi:EAL domain-containing protein (putative c-di-GMP-specific phosphodiesterase class I)/DNA-binding response OmpR family regulator/GGDEF domain-containing protein
MKKARDKTILVADDDPAQLLIAEAALAGAGFLVTTARDGAEAIREFERVQPACVILDLQMPALTGIEACRAIRQRADGHLVPILMLTGRNDLAAISSTFAAGANDFAQKGLNPRLLVERIRFLLRDREMQDDLWSSRSKLLLAQRIARVGHWEVDSAGESISVSPMLSDLLGIDTESLARYDDFIALLAADEQESVRRAFAACAAGDGGFSFDHCLRTARGTDICVHQEAELVDPTGGGQPGVVMVTIQDLTRLRRAEETVRLLSYFDTPTGLPNRQYLVDLVNAAMHEDPDAKAMAIVSFRLHSFERVMHVRGPRFASALVAQVGSRIEAALARASVGGAVIWRTDRPAVCRVAAGELAVLLRSRVSLEHVTAVTRAMLPDLCAPMECLETEYVPAVSAGIAVWPMDGGDADQLLANACAAADQAVDAASCELFSPLPQAQSRRKLFIESALRGAVERRELCLVYQPRVASDTLALAGVECLARWEHPAFGTVHPAEFISIAEETGIIDEIGRWVLAEGCRQLAEWREHFRCDFFMSVNLSGRQLRDPLLLDAVNEALVANRLPPGMLELEVTETSVVEAPEEARIVLAALRSSGVQVALDDFGTGQSSLGQIRRLPFDCLKIDRSLIADLRTDPGARDITAAVLAMARALRLRSVAEGIEDATTLEMLRALGCDEIQGYYVSRPLTADGFASWFRSGGATELRRHDAVQIDAILEETQSRRFATRIQAASR